MANKVDLRSTSEYGPMGTVASICDEYCSDRQSRYTGRDSRDDRLARYYLSVYDLSLPQRAVYKVPHTLQ